MDHRIFDGRLLLSPDAGGGAGATAAVARFAIIGDYGEQNGDFPKELGVPAFVNAWKPDFIVTLGDNAYSNHDENAFKEDVLDYYGNYIQSNAEDPDGTKTRFYPVLGNHDYNVSGGGVSSARVAAYEAAFAVPSGPGGHHYYQFAVAGVRFFMLDSNLVSTWDGYKVNSTQDQWFRQALGAATEKYKIAIFHHSPYNSSADNPNDTWMRSWKLEQADLTAVICGHAHIYERVMKGAMPFITNGVGGTNLSTARQPLVDGSVFHYDRTKNTPAAVGKYSRGAILGEARGGGLVLEFWTAGGKRLDRWPEDAAELSVMPAPAP